MKTEQVEVRSSRAAAPRHPRVRRMAGLVVLSAVVIHVLAAWLGRPPGFLTGQDDAEYAILAQSLRGGAYEELHRVDSPTHSIYPPGYPALLAVWSTVAGEGFDALASLNIALSAAMLLLLRRTLLRRGFGEAVATGSVVVLAVNPTLVAFAGSVMSEAAYTFFTVGCLLLLADEHPTTRRLVLAGGSALMAALTRSIGVTVVAALALHWMLERRWRAVAGLGVASAATVGVWLLWTFVAPEQYLGSSYVADLRTGATETPWSPGPLLRILGHAAWYARVAIPWLLAVPTVRGTPIDNAIAVLLLLVLGGVGLRISLRRWRLAAIYSAVYAGLLLVWIWHVERFAIPLLPLILPALLVGAHTIGTHLHLRRAWLLPAACALLLTVAAGVRTADDVTAALRCDRSLDLPDPACLTRDQASYFEAVRWIRDNTPDDAVILAAKSAPLWLYTRRLTVGYGAALTADATTFLPSMQEQGADYIVLGALEQAELWQLAPLLAGVCDELTLRATFPPNTSIFQIRESGNTADAAACGAIAGYLAANEGRTY